MIRIILCLFGVAIGGGLLFLGILAATSKVPTMGVLMLPVGIIIVTLTLCFSITDYLDSKKAGK